MTVSWLHRTPAALKLLGLTLAVAGLVWLHSLPWLLGVWLLLAALFTSARIPPALAWEQLRPILWLMLIAGALNGVFAGWEQALLISGRVGAALALAALVTITTPVSEILQLADRLFARALGPVRAERLALAVALTIRSVPLITELVHEVADARRARGLERSLRALVVPVIVRALKSADELGEALAARGLAD